MPKAEKAGGTAVLAAVAPVAPEWVFSWADKHGQPLFQVLRFPGKRFAQWRLALEPRRLSARGRFLAARESPRADKMQSRASAGRAELVNRIQRCAAPHAQGNLALSGSAPKRPKLGYCYERRSDSGTGCCVSFGVAFGAFLGAFVAAFWGKRDTRCVLFGALARGRLRQF